jgi:chemotaxis protein MotB
MAMEDDAKPGPIIVIKKKSGHGGHHGGAWKVAYADFVTAMMALFIVLWLLNSSEKVKEAVSGYFQDPSGTGKEKGTSVTGKGETMTVGQDNMDKLKENLEAALQQVPKFEQMKDQVQITLTNEGLRVELLETNSGMFFESGSAHPSEAGKQLLLGLAKNMGKLPNDIVIEGHTDAKPYSNRGGYSNWELSADRANSARRFMEESGLREDQVKQVRGFADQQLRKPEDPENASNRRVSVILRYVKAPGKASPAKESAAPEKSEKREAPAAGH